MFSPSFIDVTLYQPRVALDLVCQACSQVKIFFPSLGSEIDQTDILVLTIITLVIFTPNCLYIFS